MSQLTLAGRLEIPLTLADPSVTGFQQKPSAHLSQVVLTRWAPLVRSRVLTLSRIQLGI